MHIDPEKGGGGQSESGSSLANACKKATPALQNSKDPAWPGQERISEPANSVCVRVCVCAAAAVVVPLLTVPGLGPIAKGGLARLGALGGPDNWTRGGEHDG